MFKTFYRIVQTGPKPTYSAEYRVWWWPFYRTCVGPGLDERGIKFNTIHSEEAFLNVYQAANYARAHARYRNKDKFRPSVVEHLGPL
jgi:hypothetical protein